MPFHPLRKTLITLKITLISTRNITSSNRPGRVAELAEHWAGISKVVGSIPTVSGILFSLFDVHI